MNKVWQLVCFWCSTFQSGLLTSRKWDWEWWPHSVRWKYMYISDSACGLVAKSLSCVKSCWDVATSWYRYLRVLAYCFMNILTRTVNTQYTGLWILTWHALILCNTVKLVRNSGHCLSIMAGPNVLHNILCTHMLHKFIWKCNCLPMRLPCVFYICTSSVNASYS